MELYTDWVTHTREGKSMRAFLAHPAMVTQTLPAILVIQEIWGADEHIRDVTRRIASAGYVALAPDLYSRGGRPEILSEGRIKESKHFLDSIPRAAWQDPDAFRKALAILDPAKADRIRETTETLLGPRDNDVYCRDMSAWVDFLNSAEPSRGQPVASIGYCMGGALSFALATFEPRLKVAQVYYGVAPSADKMARIACPVHGFYGGKDPHITNAVPDVAKTMQELGKTYAHTIYPQAGHAFFNDTRAAYDVDAARDAWAQSLSLFRQHLAS